MSLLILEASWLLTVTVVVNHHNLFCGDETQGAKA